MNSLTELKKIASSIDFAERQKEMDCEDDVKREIINGKGTRTLIMKYNVSRKFIATCRQELRNEARL